MYVDDRHHSTIGNCPFIVNASSPTLKNPKEYMFINKIVEQHNYSLNISIVKFENSRKFTDSMIEDIKFMTVSYIY
ncbi:hypothetical protein RhiirB3_454706 [Rhizophagus irregularis]|nr:hypothetical protein RhiirB3_454706 [Rhizophagus irregularis]